MKIAQQSLWPFPVFRGRASKERGSVYGQGLKKISVDGRLGFSQFDDGKLADEAVRNTCFPGHEASKALRLCFYPFRTLKPGERH